MPDRLRRLKLASSLGTGLLVLGLGAGCESDAERERSGKKGADSSPTAGLVDVGGHRLAVRALGKGSPTVVIDSGLGETWEGWQSLAERISARATVCLYNRAAYGRSEPGPFPRTASREAAELHALLQRSGLRPPFILVGHSLGGLNALVFARSNPEMVGGMVLLDPPPREFMAGRRFQELRAMAEGKTLVFQRRAAQERDAGESAAAAFLATLASEHEMFLAQGASEIEQIAAGQPAPGRTGVGKAQPRVRGFRRRLRGVLDRVEPGPVQALHPGRLRLAPEHPALHRDEPAVVLETILDVVDEVRRDGVDPAGPR